MLRDDQWSLSSKNIDSYVFCMHHNAPDKYGRDHFEILRTCMLSNCKTYFYIEFKFNLCVILDLARAELLL